MRLISFAALLSTASAAVLLSSLGVETLKVGQTYDVEYLLDRPYTLQLGLAQKDADDNYVWPPIKTLFEDVEGVPCNGSFSATVDQTWPTSQNGTQFAFYISGMEHSGNIGYADYSGWFSIVES